MKGWLIIVTNLTFKHRVQAKAGDTFIPLTPYLTQDQPVLMRHTTCGTTYAVTPHSFLSKQSSKYHGCPTCRRQAALDKLNEALDIQGCKLLTPYRGSAQPVEVKCLYCHHIWQSTPGRLVSQDKHGCVLCPVCPHYGHRKSTRTLIS